jgi:putative oxidoreductase
MIQQLVETNTSYICLFLRIITGIIIFPYGMQKLFGWFDGPGISGTHEQMRSKNIPWFIGWLIIIAQSFGSVALILGLFGRIAAGGNFIIFTGALVVHSPDGWFLNWFGKKKGEGIEYLMMLLSILLVITINGSGAFSVDQWLMTKML